MKDRIATKLMKTDARSLRTVCENITPKEPLQARERKVLVVRVALSLLKADLLKPAGKYHTFLSSTLPKQLFAKHRSIEMLVGDSWVGVGPSGI